MLSRGERRLVQRLQDRDERAFSELVQLQGDRVFNLCFRMLNNREEAQDLAQEVFITVFKTIDSFRGDAKLSTWVYRIASNLSKNRIRYLSRRHDLSREEFDEARNKKAADSGLAAPKVPIRPDTQVEHQQLEGLMQQAISELDKDHRILIVLRDIEELSYDEICEITQLVEGTVKSRLHRARLALRNIMIGRM